MPVYSHSRLQAFETCPLKYKFQYIDRLESPIEKTVEMFVGSQVHEALEKHYNDLQLQKLNSLNELLGYYEALWKKEWNPGVKITREGFTQKHYFDYGAKCIGNYYERYAPFDQSQTLATELRLNFSLDDQKRYQMMGFIDRVGRRSDGTFEIHDYKTGASAPSQEVLDNDRQLALYQIGLKKRWPQAEHVELVWHYVGCDMTFLSVRSPDQLEEVRAATIRTIDQVEAERSFNPAKGPWCAWCEFQPVCPLWKHEIAVNLLPAEEFDADEGVRLANQIAEVKRQVDRWSQRYEQLKGLIADYCSQHNLRVVAGNGVRVSVKSTEQMRFPGKNDPEREALEQLVRRLGHWDDVATLDVNELKRILKERLWPEAALLELRSLAEEERSTHVSVRSTETTDDDEA